MLEVLGDPMHADAYFTVLSRLRKEWVRLKLREVVDEERLAQVLSWVAVRCVVGTFRFQERGALAN